MDRSGDTLLETNSEVRRENCGATVTLSKRGLTSEQQLEELIYFARASLQIREVETQHKRDGSQVIKVTLRCENANHCLREAITHTDWKIEGSHKIRCKKEGEPIGNKETAGEKRED